MYECIQYYFSLNGSDGNLNIIDYNINVSMRPLARSKTNKNSKCETFVDYDQQIKHQTRIKIKGFHNNVLSL